MNNSIDPTIIYPDLKAAAAAVCQRWCEQQGYSDRFYQDGSWWAFPPNSVLPVNIHEVIDLEHTLAQRVRIKHYYITLSIALLPDSCIAPHNHPEI
ncbi:MAG: hypothetical protein QNJ41_28655 [Xenococcaceae cyanobacterium MO_188.B32]|nr:hypothetical protein [Xenococcaceae cyanobacterium MO_188.B32]